MLNFIVDLVGLLKITRSGKILDEVVTVAKAFYLSRAITFVDKASHLFCILFTFSGS